MDVSITTGSDVVQAFRLITNWAVASKGWSTGVSGSLVAEAGLEIMMVFDHPSSNDFVVFATCSGWVLFCYAYSLSFGHPRLCHSYYLIVTSI